MFDEFYTLQKLYHFLFFQETAEFDLHFEKVYKWVASSVNDKETFISCLWKVFRISDKIDTNSLSVIKEEEYRIFVNG